jgi:ATP-dependent Clp protease ATP-binding subunit ClpA
MPRDLLDLVSSTARRLGRQVAGDDLFLLALSELSAESAARQALEAEGVDGTRLLSEIRTRGDGPSEKTGGLTFAPAFYSMEGRAQAFAATLGDGTITPDHVLMALLWDPVSASSQLLWRLGVSRQRIVQRLRDYGVPVPSTSLPPQREIEVGDRVWFDRQDVRVVLDHLLQKVPPGTCWGFNYDGQRAWVLAETSVNLQELVDEALAAS